VLISHTKKNWPGSVEENRNTYSKLFLFMKLICEESKLKLGFTSHGWDAKFRKKVYEVVNSNKQYKIKISEV
jgi:hypothetical protein